MSIPYSFVKIKLHEKGKGPGVPALSHSPDLIFFAAWDDLCD